ncbi:MAG: hypothetical protein AAF738_10885 [Bacteroidota bacterium]
MRQITLEIQSNLDLQLLLSLARRLDIKVVSMRTTPEHGTDEKLELMQAAANDPLFLADIEAISDDFKYVDFEL